MLREGEIAPLAQPTIIAEIELSEWTPRDCLRNAAA
jgi:hypothetical protein